MIDGFLGQLAARFSFFAPFWQRGLSSGFSVSTLTAATLLSFSLFGSDGF